MLDRLRSLDLSPSSLARRVYANAKDSVRIDTRTLAVFRVFVGLLILADLVLRSRNLHYFYTDEGVVPLSLATEAAGEHAFSVYFISGDPTVTAALFVIHALVALQLIVGYKTRIATVLALVFVVSLDHRNTLVLSYADTLFRLLLFWAIFLPLGERWSVDAVHRDRVPRATVANLATAAALLQMVVMYFINGYLKSTSDVWTSGEATPLVMGLDDITFFLGDTVAREFPTLLMYGGLLWYYMMVLSWLLIVLVGRKRMLLMSLYFGGHAVFAVTVRIGAFPYVAMAGLILFLQTQFWTDAKTVARFVGVEPSRVYDRASRISRVADYFPDVRFDSDRQREAKKGVYVAVFGLVVVVYVVAGAFSHAPVDGVAGISPEEKIEGAASVLNVDQPNWSIFAPSPRTTDRYYVFPALTEDGEKYDVYNDRNLTYERPYDRLHKQYERTYRERFYMNDIRRAADDGRNDSPEILSDHLCDDWSERLGSNVTHVNMWYIAEDVEMHNIDRPENRTKRTIEMNKHGCGDNHPKEIERAPLGAALGD